MQLIILIKQIQIIKSFNFLNIEQLSSIAIYIPVYFNSNIYFCLFQQQYYSCLFQQHYIFLFISIAIYISVYFNSNIYFCLLIRILIEDSDQNLKYLGLLAMSKILKTSPKSVSSHKVTNCSYFDQRLYIYSRIQ